ncbi:vigilin-like [Chiloscyllium plagiosum]|uniref:vigilin-like n=1 Tax=Chiloscyllium plagiosum TaxID=36176 RepID=UPI001CB86A53|nr:vigilin-like [Chiloscyllium plagiosum]
MSSVAVLTPESFAEHRSGLGDQETRGGVPEDEAYIPTYLEAFPPLPEKGTPGDKSGEPIGAWSKIRPIKSSVITQVFHVPLEERRYKDNSQFGEGEEAKVCLDIMQKTGAHIELSLAKDQGLSIMVTGKLDSVMKARKEIVARLQTQVGLWDWRTVVTAAGDSEGCSRKILISKESVSFKRVNCFPNPPGEPLTSLKILSRVEFAACLVLGLASFQLFSFCQQKRKTTTISVEVKKSQHKYIIGPKGNTLQEILDMTGVSVEMPSLESSSETIILRGEPDKLGPALTQVYAKAKSVMVAEVTAPAWLHRFIIGKKGQNIGRITQQLPKVHIEFTDGDEKITLEGPTEEVEIAQTQIQDIINDLLTRMDYTEITVEQKYHRHLIGKNGANINRIKEQYKVSVRIPPDNEKSNLIRIEGEPQGVQLAKKELLEMAVRMENERTKDLIIEQRLHRSIIGQKGEKIKEVRDKFPEVIINFPDPVQKSDIVQLRGPKTEVEKCGKFLQKVIADLIENSYSVSIPIFKQFHKNIIGKGGANIKKIREETNTKIDLPTENSNSEVILITGKKANCEAARDRILAIQRELVHQTGSIPVHCSSFTTCFLSEGLECILQDIGKHTHTHTHTGSVGSGSSSSWRRLERAGNRAVSFQAVTGQKQRAPMVVELMKGEGQR